jgi:hypothetical protein
VTYDGNILDDYVRALQANADQHVVAVEGDADSNALCHIVPEFKVVRGKLQLLVRRYGHNAMYLP